MEGKRENLLMSRKKKARKTGLELKRRLSRPKHVAWWPHAEQRDRATLRKQEDTGQGSGMVVPCHFSGLHLIAARVM